MAAGKKKKGPRQAAGLQCGVCKSFGYITEYNKNNEILKKQTTNESTFPLNKYCSVCRKHTTHKLAKKLK
ncbi:MAG: 50S ribosomal protein L33 [Candidatus Pacebacteria bacterium RIFCSPHIGHO2_01_FULL_46_16]|nr:MAG: 50S ribosomal protein L33 [Candidatus Pacebacteria bacterium RIFCSPHIGHO2_01_FULL_46_16]OGJ21929.1 MAG: 50S ribosomal protein L33 [Candidatus Pacebacteria bacterium RIFCSPHIGHO2_02_FULL_46_9]OGJ38753.1 MAG: 50S ribosomal protein L33 [Candidatus Pacebacteria bacterium RIFCSPLOWO2_01_FULL_47_12]